MANPEKPEGNENTKKPKKQEKHKKKGGRRDTYKNFESMNWKTLYQQHDKMGAIINLLCTYHHTEHDMYLSLLPEVLIFKVMSSKT
jgi:hypothetical protein